LESYRVSNGLGRNILLGVTLFSKLHFVDSKDGVRRLRMKWKPHKFTYFATVNEVRELVRDLMMLLKDESERIDK
jgi:hypothetical protein